MEEEILIPESEQEIVATKILRKRVGNKLYLANKGCHSLIGCVEKIGEIYFIEGYINQFRTEYDAEEALLFGI